MKKIIFIEPKAPNFHIFSQFKLPRIGAFILAAIMKQKGWSAQVWVEELQPLDFEQMAQADLVGISTITSTAPRAYAIADRLRQMGIPVIMGGPHVTYLTEEALQHSDFVVRGEGEKPLQSFIQHWETDKNFSAVPSLSFLKEGKIVNNPCCDFEDKLDTVPFPDLSLSQVPLQRIHGEKIIPIQTSRGCPFDCSFCSVTGMFGKKYRHRSTQNVIQELRQYDQKKNFIFFYDDNFTANRRLAKELLTAMIAEKFKFKWSTQVRADVAKDPELVGLMKKAGCHTVYIGFESVNPDTLAAMHKSQTVSEMETAIRVLRKSRIHIHGMFVFGFDEDNKKTIKETVNFAKKNKLTSVQFMILTPLPGSELYRNMEQKKRIKFCDWALYDAHHAVFEPEHLSLFDLQRAQMWGHNKFYSLKESWLRLLRGQFLSVGIAHYARGINKKWTKSNKTFLKIMKLLRRPKKEESITINYMRKVLFDDKRVLAHRIS